MCIFEMFIPQYEVYISLQFRSVAFLFGVSIYIMEERGVYITQTR